MQTAAINWRPLGELFLEAGLITQSELDEALSVQTETRERLGQILVSRGLVTEPELLRVLLDQLGRELEKEGAPGALAHDLALRRAVPAPAAEAPAAQNGEARADVAQPADDPVAAARAAFEAALVRERADLEKTLTEKRTALKATVSQAATPPPPAAPAAVAPQLASVPEPVTATPEPAPAPPAAPVPIARPTPPARPVASPPVDVSLLLRQAQDLREDLARETAAHETALRNATAELEQRVAGLEGALANERADHRRAVDEIERARSEARREAGELRAAVNRLRNDLAQIDAATAWFEYWSGTAQPPPA